jgi:hypothetical protein
MAYNTSRGARGLGDIKNEEDIDTQIDFDNDKITFKTNDVARLVIDNDHVSGSGALEIVGAATVGGNLFVSGSVSMGHGLAGDGALDIKLQNGNPQIIARYSTTHKTNLLTTSNGKFRIAPTGRTLEIDTGDTNGGNIHFTKNAAATVAGGIAWNTSNEDVTLYSEADLHLGGGGLSESMFTLDSTGKVGIGMDPTHLLTVAGAISGSSTLEVVGNTFVGGALNVTGAVTATGIASGSTAGPGSFLAVTTAGVLVLDEPAGGGISWDGSTANGVATYKDGDEATVEANLTFDGNTLTATNASNTAIPAIKIDRDYTGTTSIGNYTTDPQGLLIDYDVTGIVASGQTAIHDAISINYNQDSPTMVGTIEATGADIRMTGGTSGTQSMKGIAMTLAGASTITGIDITAPNDSAHFIARSSDALLDQFKISVGASGATTLSTNDADASAGNLTLDADGKIIIEAIAGDEVVFNEGSADVDFRVETADESHMLFIEGSSNRMSIGDNTGSPGATLEVKNNASAGATGVPLVQLNSHDTDQQCLDINADNITANVVNITANDVTTARVLAIGADGLTTGNAVHVDDNSADTGTRNTALIIQNNAAAIAATALTVQSDGGITGVKLDKNYSDTTAATVTGLNIDFDKTGASTSNNTMYGLNIDMDNTTATNGNNYMYGLHVTPTLTHAADAGGAFLYGAFINAQGGTNGSSLVQGARIEAGGGDVNYGIQLDVEDGGVDLRIESSADSGDYFQIQTTTHGATTITTVDDDATAADLTFTIDGDITLDPAGGDVIVDGNVSGSGDLQFVGAATLGNTLVVSGNVGSTPSLGLGTSTVHAAENNYLSIANGTEPSFATADQISIGSKDSTGYGSGNGATFSMNTEGLVENSPANLADLSHRVSVWINGTEYFIYLDPV